MLAAVSPDTWPCNTLGNHDTPRLYTRFGDGAEDSGAEDRVHDDELARLHLALLLTLKGTPFLYNGDEIGMTNLDLPDISLFRDTMATWLYHNEVEQFGVDPTEALAYACKFTRDQGRSPLQWCNAPNAGFCPPGVTPWLPVNLNYARGVNVADQEKEPDSLLNFYRRMLRLRRQTPALVEGEYVPLLDGRKTRRRGDMEIQGDEEQLAEDCLVFLRKSREQTCLVALNFSGKTLVLDTAKMKGMPVFRKATRLFPDGPISINEGRFILHPWIALIVDLK